MTTLETIHQKVIHLPPKAQEEVLEAVERIEEQYQVEDVANSENGKSEGKHPLTLIAELALDAGVTDLAERHDFYAHRKVED